MGALAAAPRVARALQTCTLMFSGGAGGKDVRAAGMSPHAEDDAKEGDHKQSGQAHNGAAAQRFDGACVNEGMK